MNVAKKLWKPALVVVVFALVAVIAGVMSMIGMPGKSYSGEPPQRPALAEVLEGHVRGLAETIGPRNVMRAEANSNNSNSQQQQPERSKQQQPERSARASNSGAYKSHGICAVASDGIWVLEGGADCQRVSTTVGGKLSAILIEIVESDRCPNASIR